MRHLVSVLAMLLLAFTGARSVAAQAPGVADSSVLQVGPLPQKSVALASLLGLAFPGAGHWYAGETRRAGVVAGMFATSVVMIGIADPARSHEWNGAERAAGWLWLGTLAFGWIDGTLAARRYNLRAVVSAGPASDAGHRAIHVGLSTIR